MQIDSTLPLQSTPSQALNSTPVNGMVARSEHVANAGVAVSLSETAIQLANSGNASATEAEIQPVPAPPPSAPLHGDQLDKAVQIKKAQMAYNLTSEMANIVNNANNGNNGVSVVGVYYLSQNEDARETALNLKSQQQNMQTLQAYQQQTAELNDMYSQY